MDPGGVRLKTLMLVLIVAGCGCGSGQNRSKREIDQDLKLGTICRSRCHEAQAYVSGYCSAIFSFGGTLACSLIGIHTVLLNPLICGVTESIFWSISDVCGTDVLETSCKKCMQEFDMEDVLLGQKTVHLQLNRTTELLADLTCDLRKNACRMRRQVTTAINQMKTRLSFHHRHDGFLNQIRYLNYLLGRIKFGKRLHEDPTFRRLLSVASDTDNIGSDILSLIQLYHDRMVGGGGAHINRIRPPSIFELDPTFCLPSKLATLDSTMLVLVQLMHLKFGADAYATKEDLQELQDWIQELRNEQRLHVRKECTHIDDEALQSDCLESDHDHHCVCKQL